MLMMTIMCHHLHLSTPRTVRDAEEVYAIVDREGKGYVTAAVREIERLCFADLGLERVQIRADVANVRSRAIPERLGYTLEGVLRRSAPSGGGRLTDHAMYSLLKPEWLDRERIPRPAA